MTDDKNRIDLTDPQPGVYLIVSMVVMQVATERARWTGDLLVPGEQVRDAAGRIVGCRSLRRCAPELEPAPGWEQRAEDRARQAGLFAGGDLKPSDLTAEMRRQFEADRG